MIWASWSDFFAMGGYAFYVWGSYAVTAGLIIGNLGRDPEVRSFQNGGKVVNLRIATSESWKDKTTGQPQERTEWHNIDLWGKQAENAAEYLGKGSHVNIVGRLRTKNYEKDGETVYRKCSDHHHHHLVCRECGTTVEIAGPTVERRNLWRTSCTPSRTQMCHRRAERAE